MTISNTMKTLVFELPWIAAQVHLNCPYYCNPDYDLQALQLPSHMMSKLPSNIEQSGCHPTSWPCLHLHVCHAVSASCQGSTMSETVTQSTTLPPQNQPCK